MSISEEVTRAARTGRATLGHSRRWARRTATRWRLPALGAMSDDDFIEGAYRFVLQRDADPAGREVYRTHLREGTRTRSSMLAELRGSDEFWFGFAHKYEDAIIALHRSRCLFVESFPRAARILDIGGTHQSSQEGALVMLGYPYDFERLVILDLPTDDRHELYQPGGEHDIVTTSKGPAEYVYRSMADLSVFDDASFDLVYSGQSIEHVPEDVADQTLAEVFRVLRPGGWLALDTPNGRLCRIQLAGTGLAVTNPDHDVEYDHEQLAAKLVAAGFDVREAKGLNYLPKTLASGVFDFDELERSTGVFHEIEDCYLLAYLAQKPA